MDVARTKRDPERIYWRSFITGQSVNLSAALQGEPCVKPLFVAPVDPPLAIRDALAALCQRHPRARTEPPFRWVHLWLEGRWPIHPYDEVLLRLPDGMYVGVVDHVTFDGGWVALELREAGYCILNSYGTRLALSRGEAGDQVQPRPEAP